MRLIVTCMKNEGPFILEWVAYHLSIGFDRFLIYTNDCDDMTDKIVDRLSKLGICEHLDNPRVGKQRPQAVAMRDMLKRDVVKAADWVLFSDCDEFLNIHVGDGSLGSLLNQMGDAEIISPMWRLFGDSGISDFKDVPITEQFRRAAPQDRPVSVNAWGFKSLFKPSAKIDRIGAHRPFFNDEAAIAGKWLTSSGQPMGPGTIKQGWRYVRGTGGYDWVQMNHYAVRSVDSFLVKCHRGHVLHTHKDIDLGYYKGMNQNHELDETILRRKESFHKVLGELKQDETLRALHQDAVRHHTQRARQLRHDQKTLYDAIRPKAAMEESNTGR